MLQIVLESLRLDQLLLVDAQGTPRALHRQDGQVEVVTRAALTRTHAPGEWRVLFFTTSSTQRREPRGSQRRPQAEYCVDVEAWQDNGGLSFRTRRSTPP